MKRFWAGAVAVMMAVAGSALAKEPENIPSFAQPAPEKEAKKKKSSAAPSSLRDLSVLVGGGFEGFTGGLGDSLQVGPSWGATVSVKPSVRIGAELAYTGATHEFDLATGGDGGSGSGADVVRNGGHVAGSLGLLRTAMQPYVLAGIGINRFDVRNPVSGFSDSTSGYVPLAGGLRYTKGLFTADARMGVNVQFADELGINPATQEELNGTYYDGMIRVGARF